LLFGNTISPTMQALWRVYGSRPFPWNWIAYWALLLAIFGPVYVLCTTIVWWLAPSSHPPLLEYIATGWKFPVVVVVVFSFSVFLYRITKDRLEQRNLELQQTVEKGAAELNVQKQELQRAREIQESLLPKQIPQMNGFEVSAAWRPAREVSGDYFDVFRLGENAIAFCVADVVGKGVSAALLMANVQAAVRAFASEHITPAVLCTKVNRLLCENLATGKFVTLLFGILYCASHRIVYCNAGHPDPILVSRGQAAALDGSGAVLGVFSDWEYRDGTVDLHAGDRLLVFTDGLTEAADDREEEFGEVRITQVAEKYATRSAAELNEALLGQVDTFCHSRFQDDATLLVVAAK
jgi:phosphoserine phosphatase RsbU/P